MYTWMFPSNNCETANWSGGRLSTGTVAVDWFPRMYSTLPSQCAKTRYQYGKPAHEADVPMAMPRDWGLCFLCIMITEKRTKIVLSHNDYTLNLAWYVRLHTCTSISTLHAPIYRNFYLCVWRRKKIKHKHTEISIKKNWCMESGHKGS